MKKLQLSKKGNMLLDCYKDFINNGYYTVTGEKIKLAYNDFELKAYKDNVKKIIIDFNIKTVLDYGSGGSDWYKNGFDKIMNSSAIEFFNLKEVKKYEPARGVDERSLVDCVICFDVLEHIFLGDIKNVLVDIYKHAKKLVILQIACYNARALLPNGENAHITIRQPQWWKGYVDSVASEFLDVSTLLMCSEGYKKTKAFPVWKGKMWHEDKKFKIDY